MTFIESERVKIDRVRCVHGCAMTVAGEKGALHRLGKEIACLMHNYSRDSHGEGLTVRMIDKPTTEKTGIKDTLYVFVDSGYMDDIYSLVEQRINEGFKVEIETGNMFPWSREYRYEPSVVESIEVEETPLDEYPF